MKDPEPFGGKDGRYEGIMFGNNEDRRHQKTLYEVIFDCLIDNRLLMWSGG